MFITPPTTYAFADTVVRRSDPPRDQDNTAAGGGNYGFECRKCPRGLGLGVRALLLGIYSVDSTGPCKACKLAMAAPRRHEAGCLPQALELKHLEVSTWATRVTAAAVVAVSAGRSASRPENSRHDLCTCL